MAFLYMHLLHLYLRFTTAEGTSKNRIVAPGKIMHFYNSPPDSSEESLAEVQVNGGGGEGVKEVVCSLTLFFIIRYFPS